jgi:hypothetical protein
MDLRGQRPDRGQNDQVQVASEPITREHEDRHISVDPSRENSAVPEARTAGASEGEAVAPAGGAVAPAGGAVASEGGAGTSEGGPGVPTVTRT